MTQSVQWPQCITWYLMDIVVAQTQILQVFFGKGKKNENLMNVRELNLFKKYYVRLTSWSEIDYAASTRHMKQQHNNERSVEYEFSNF